MFAVILGKALYCMSPSYSKTDAARKSRDWKDFMDKLDFEKLTKPKDIGRMFQVAGIPIISPSNKKPDKGVEK